MSKARRSINVSKIALVHDYFVQMGGAERVAEAMHDSFPSAPMYTTVALPQSLPDRLRRADIRTSPLQNLPAMESRFRHYFMLYPFAVENFNLSQYDLIFSSSSGYAKGVRRRRNAIHVCYCHTPMRWVWRYEDYVARERFGGFVRAALPARGWKKWTDWGLSFWDACPMDWSISTPAVAAHCCFRAKKILAWRRSRLMLPAVR